MRKFIYFFIVIFLVGSCSAPIKEYSEKIYIKSVSYRFIDELVNGEGVTNELVEIPVWIALPSNEEFSEPYPVVVLLHSSWGLSSQESFYANAFKEIGVATLVIDSFGPRGVSKTSIDQTLVSSASMIKDAYAALEFLQSDPKFDGNRVAVMGFSKGGIVALYSALEKIKRISNEEENNQFAAHIAYYPWCGMRLNDMKLTGAPILIQGGDKDIVTPINKCIELISSEFGEEEKELITLKKHASARHAFDHPVLSKIPIPISLNAQAPADCDIREDNNGKFYEHSNNVHITGDNIKSVLQNCSTYNGVAGYNKEVTKNSLRITKEFLREHILEN